MQEAQARKQLSHATGQALEGSRPSTPRSLSALQKLCEPPESEYSEHE